MKVLVIGGTGKVGLGLVDRLLERGLDVRVLVRSPARAAMLPAPAEAFLGDVTADPIACAGAFSGVDAVFMLNKASATELIEGVLAVRLAQEAGVKRFVYQSVHLLDQLAGLPHVAPKVGIKKAVEISGMDYAFIAPNHFFQNDEMIEAALIKSGRYLMPLGPIGCWGVDARDIAEAAAVVLTTEGHSGRTYNVVGPRALTSEEAARIWSAALDRPVRCGTLEEWAEFVRPFLPAWLHFDLYRMYAGFQREGMLGDQADVRALEALIGRPPRPYEDYVREQAGRIKSMM